MNLKGRQFFCAVGKQKAELIDIINMETIMWANEPFDPDKPDTFYLEVWQVVVLWL
jgi:hypothetical protein